MKVVAKYRAETDKGTLLYFDAKQIPDAEILKGIASGAPFVFFALNDAKGPGRNRVVCDKMVHKSDGLEMYVSLFIDDLCLRK